jgi:beta-galactosidase
MFRDGFLLGFSLAGFQSEMGMGENDENSDWWKWVHDENNIRTGLVSGDQPEDGVAYWELYKNYNEMAKSLGSNAFRLGVEWTRLFPKATPEIKVNVKEDEGDIISIDVTEKTLNEMDRVVNKEALQHYKEIFENVKENGMKLIINAYHWPLPLSLHDPIISRESGLKNEQNGWLNHKTVIEFVKYAAYLAWKFDSLADQFSIMNEPNVVFGNGYFNVKSGFPPAYPSIEAGNLSKKHIIEAIGRAYDEMKKFTKSPVGLIYANADLEPENGEDIEATEMALFNERYSFFDSLIFGDMKWIKVINEAKEFNEKSKEIREDLRGKLDWIGVNYYTRNVISRKEGSYTVVRGYGHNAVAGMKSKAGLEVSDFGWELYPEGLYNVLKQYHEHYKLPMIVTENGLADSFDLLRPKYLVSHIHQVEKAINDGIDVRGYLHWSLLDNYEWSSGFGMKFGLLGVDLKTKKIQMRPSALVFKYIAQNRGIPEDLKWMTQ